MRNIPLTAFASSGSSCALIAYTRGATRALGRSIVSEAGLYDVLIPLVSQVVFPFGLRGQISQSVVGQWEHSDGDNPIGNGQ